MTTMTISTWSAGGGKPGCEGLNMHKYDRDRDREMVRLGLWHSYLEIDTLEFIANFSKGHPEICLPLAAWDELNDGLFEIIKIAADDKTIDDWIDKNDDPLRAMAHRADGETYREYILRMAEFLREKPDLGNR